MVLSVFLCYIRNNLVTTVILKVQIYIWQLLTLQVKKALKDQLIFNRVNFSNTQAVKNNTGSGTTPNPKQYIALPDKGNDVPDNKEVVSKLSLLYNFQFIVKLLLYLESRLGLLAGQTFITEISQKLVGSFPFW